jgi:putative glutamine amidotransferase
MASPLIGITGSLQLGGQEVDLAYIDAVAAAGGTPVLVPLTTTVQASAPLLRRLDGLVIIGGPGIVAGLVGQLPADLAPVPARRWHADIAAFDAMARLRRPLLGICYGMQLINARCGGSLLADVQASRGVGPHSPGRNGGLPVQHDVELVAGSLLSVCVGASRLPVNSSHVQAIECPGQGLRPVAVAPDGVCEAIESEDGRMIGVQFHPERLPGTPWAALFAWLVDRARAGRRKGGQRQ